MRAFRTGISPVDFAPYFSVFVGAAVVVSVAGFCVPDYFAAGLAVAFFAGEDVFGDALEKPSSGFLPDFSGFGTY